MALAGLAGCTKQPDEPIYPYVKAPEDLILGKPNYFASAPSLHHRRGSCAGQERRVSPRQGRRQSRPSYQPRLSDPFTQGSLLDLYDPDRSQHVIYRGGESRMGGVPRRFHDKLAVKKANDGTGIYFLSPPSPRPPSPRQWKAGAGRVSQGDAGAVRSGQSRLRLCRDSKRPWQRPTTRSTGSGADVIVSLDADFLSGITHPGFHKLVADYAQRRKGSRQDRHEPALHRRERADHHRHEGRASPWPARQRNSRLCCGSGRCSAEEPARFAAIPGPASSRSFSPPLPRTSRPTPARARSFPASSSRRKSHLAAIAINQALGNVGKTVVYTETVNPLPPARTTTSKSRRRSERRQGRLARHSECATRSTQLPSTWDFDEALSKVKTLRPSRLALTTRPAQLPTGISTARIISSRGPMPAPTTAPSPSCSR